MTPLIKSPDIVERLDGALKRFTDRDFSMRVPVDPTDIDVALSDAKVEIINLRAELEASNQKRKEAVMDAERAREERNREHVKLNAEWVERTAALRAELEAREADRRDQLTRLLTTIEKDSEWANPRAVDWTRGVLLATVKIALAQRQEGEEK